MTILWSLQRKKSGRPRKRGPVLIARTWSGAVNTEEPMTNYDLTSIGAVTTSAKLAHIRANQEPDQSSYNAAWLRGYADALTGEVVAVVNERVLVAGIGGGLYLHKYPVISHWEASTPNKVGVLLLYIAVLRVGQCDQGQDRLYKDA